ncbi:hypothetical protein BOX15_Mlig016957g1 [Macrostomum lignano]|uniref:Palmitoyltransferase n=1 Tax=Macrostomum lignano TaxID=282301 RepID=A0A267DQ02_9PLAT|nr:hypothetical protein BOX15_Mlig016957g1 [Macrostomum lignano]
MTMSECLKRVYCFVKTLPLIFIIILIGWSYYAFVVALCINSVPAEKVGEKVALIIFYHVFFGMFVWSYIQTIIARPKIPPKEFLLSNAEFLEHQSNSEEPSRQRDQLLRIIADKHLPVFTRGMQNSIRVCQICQLIKPDRAHHCATCGICLLKMDHHCPWVNNCVGYHNYKYFVLFLLYGALYCCYTGSGSAKYFVDFWMEGVSDIQAFRFHVLFLFFAAWMFCISLLALGGYHLHLAMSNLTTLESFRAPVLAGTGGPDKRAYNVGAARNFCQVFGNTCYLWFLPVRNWQTDGINWQHRASYSPGQQSYASMESGHADSPSRTPVEKQQLVPTSTSGRADQVWPESETQ